MMRGEGWTAGLTACLALVFGLLACTPTAPAVAPAASVPAGGTAADSGPRQGLIEGARREGQLTLTWTESGMGGPQGVQRLAEGFNRHYGLNLNVQYVVGGSNAEMGFKLVQEYQAGRRASTDVYYGADSTMAPLLAVDGLEPVDWLAWATNVRSPDQIGLNGVAVTTQTLFPGIAYNSQRVTGDAIPRRLQDLLAPQYKGRIASTAEAASFDRLALPELWGRDRTLEYTTRLADQIAGLIRCPAMDRLSTGEFDILAISCNQRAPFAAKAEGAPIDFLIAADAPMLLYLYLSVPRHAAHPNAAKLFIDYVLSREVQDALYASDASDSHLVPGSKSAADIDQVRATGVQFVVSNLESYLTHDQDEQAEIRKELARILGKR